MPNTSDNFYAQLPSFTNFDDFADPLHYQPLPDDWYVVISDIEGSTKAIEKGRYREVNALGTASIVALVNAVLPLKIPYVFGGDGASLCVPSGSYHAVASALVATADMAEEKFKLKLRIGMVAMRTITQSNHEVLIGKYQPHANYQQAMFLGDGLAYAEKLIKSSIDPNPYHINPVQFPPDGSFAGFECRWNEIPSPHEETLAILIQAIGKDKLDQQSCYQQILAEINRIYGPEEEHHPIRQEAMQLSLSPQKLNIEQRILGYYRSYKERLINKITLPLMMLAGRYLMKKGIDTDENNWSQYQQQTIINTDYRKFDELLRMVISGTQQQRENLDHFLKHLEQAGKINYGIHASQGALMTCLIFNYDTDHVHFLDGSQGGYAIAAKSMKQKIKLSDQS